MTFLTPTERRILARETELESVYDLVEATALAASPDEHATLFARSREIVAEIAALKRAGVER